MVSKSEQQDKIRVQLEVLRLIVKRQQLVAQQLIDSEAPLFHAIGYSIKDTADLLDNHLGVLEEAIGPLDDATIGICQECKQEQGHAPSCSRRFTNVPRYFKHYP